MESKVLDILKRICETDEVIENRDIDLFKNELLDSLRIIELLIAIEDEFGISLDPAEINREELETPNKLIQYINMKLK